MLSPESLRRSNSNQTFAARRYGVNRVMVWNRERTYRIDP